jgi:hypothetical protein
VEGPPEEGPAEEGAFRRGMLAQLEKTLKIALVWLVPRVSVVRENVNFGDLTYHPKDPRGILATLIC